jgi:transcriptional regulator with XRE-family HTH domain
MEYGQRLAFAMELAGLPPRGGPSQLARGIGTTPQAIAQVLKGETKALTAENTAKAAKFLNVDWFWLATGNGAAKPHSNQKSEELALRFASLHPLAQEELMRILAELELSAGR